MGRVTAKAPELSPERYKISRHAAKRALDMGLAVDELVAPLRSPEKRMPGPLKHPGTELWTNGRVAAAVEVEPDGRVAVLTFLWSTDEFWRADYDFPPPEGRMPRTRPITTQH